VGGLRLFNRGSLPLFSFLKEDIRVCSNFLASSAYSTHLKRKYFTFIKRFICLCESSLDFIDVSLLPMYTTTCFISPSSYAPGLSGAKSVLSLKGYHFVPIGIFHPFRIFSLLYQTVSYYIQHDTMHTMPNIWQASRASLCPLALASGEGLSR
jgi:hypothetical protein